MRMYDLLPEVVRRLDGDTNNNILELLLEAFDEVQEDISSDISELVNLIDVSTINAALLPYLGHVLQAPGFNTTEEFLERWFTRSSVPIHKKKGTLLSWNKHFRYSGQRKITLVELYKSTTNETKNYSPEQDAQHLLPSARIHLVPCETTCETVAEYDYLTASVVLEEIEYIKPIQVLLPHAVIEIESEDLFADSLDTLGCSSSCETGSELWTGSLVTSVFQDAFPMHYDDLIITQTCVASCEISCTSCCEVDCEQSTCQLKCEVNCETSCTHTCETYCQACSEVVCSTSCEVHCQENCAGFCEASCQVACQEHECQAGSIQQPNLLCTLGVTIPTQCKNQCMLLACTLGCTTSLTGPPPPPPAICVNCQGACEQGCQYGCTSMSCQGGACEAGIAQGTVYTETGEFCNRCPVMNKVHITDSMYLFTNPPVRTTMKPVYFFEYRGYYNSKQCSWDTPWPEDKYAAGYPYYHGRGYKDYATNGDMPLNQGPYPYPPNMYPYPLGPTPPPPGVFGAGAINFPNRLVHAMTKYNATTVYSWIYDGTWHQMWSWNYSVPSDTRDMKISSPQSVPEMRRGEFYINVGDYIYFYTGGINGIFIEENYCDGDGQGWYPLNPSAFVYWYYTSHQTMYVYDNKWMMFAGKTDDNRTLKFVYKYNGIWGMIRLQLQAYAANYDSNVVTALTLDRLGHGYVIVYFQYNYASFWYCLFEIDFAAWQNDDDYDVASDFGGEYTVTIPETTPNPHPAAHYPIPDYQIQVWDAGNTYGPFRVLACPVNLVSSSRMDLSHINFKGGAGAFTMGENGIAVLQGRIYMACDVNYLYNDGNPYTPNQLVYWGIAEFQGTTDYVVNFGYGREIIWKGKFKYVGPPLDQVYYDHYYFLIGGPDAPVGYNRNKIPEGFKTGVSWDYIPYGPGPWLIEDRGYDDRKGMIYIGSSLHFSIFRPGRTGALRFMNMKTPNLRGSNEYVYAYAWGGAHIDRQGVQGG